MEHIRVHLFCYVAVHVGTSTFVVIFAYALNEKYNWRKIQHAGKSGNGGGNRDHAITILLLVSFVVLRAYITSTELLGTEIRLKLHSFGYFRWSRDREWDRVRPRE